MSYPPGAAGPPIQPPEGQYPPPGPGMPYQPPGYPPGYYPPPPVQSTSGFAIASLIFGVCGFCGGFLLSIVFGIIALGRTKPGGQRGRGLAIAGLALSGVWAVVAVIVVIAAVSGAFSANHTESALSVKQGQCLAEVPTGNRVSSVHTTSCDRSHAAEVIAVLTMPDGPYPGQFVFSDYKHRCGEALNTYSSTASTDPNIDLAVMPPSEQSWAHGDRAMVCIATFSTNRTGSIKD